MGCGRNLSKNAREQSMEQAQIETINPSYETLEIIKFLWIFNLQLRDCLIEIWKNSNEWREQLPECPTPTRASFTESGKQSVHLHLKNRLQHKCDEV